MRSSFFVTMSFITLLFSATSSRADIVIGSSGNLMDGKVVSRNSQEIVFQADGSAPPPQHISSSNVSRVIITDEHGAVVADGSTKAPASRWKVPPAPAAPPVTAPPAGRPTYCVIPLHGEVGSTILASALEQSLADAIARKPTVIVLDIDSPGGLVEESQRITKVLHHYNKLARIVALADRDLSAAAIFTLAVKEIYVKSTSTIGAATSYIPGNLNLPPKIEEKMQSAWRAAARNSAEEGGHEPLLAEAMIDNDMELHLETSGGKPVVKEGPGEQMLCRQGKILTLSSHEAVQCGLAAGDADDFDELGKQLKLLGWTEAKGLGTLLAEYLPKREEVLKSESTRIVAQFQQDMQRAKDAAPTDEISQVVIRPIGPHRIMPGAYRPSQTVITRVSHANWKAKSLECVVALQQAEQNLADEATLCEAFGEAGAAELFHNALTEISALRARIYDDRNKYGNTINNQVATNSPAWSSNAPPHAQPVSDNGLVPGASETPIVGGSGGGPFTKASSSGQPVLGFHYSTGEWMRRTVLRELDPVFERPAGDPSGDSTLVIGRSGYVVVSITVETDGNNVTAVQATFAPLRNGRIYMSSSYKSKWMGVATGKNVHQLSASGRVAIGVFGRKGLNLDAVGLVLASPGAAGQQSSGSQEIVTATPAPAPPPQQDSNVAAGGTQTELLGGTGGRPFTHVNPAGGPVVGFHYMLGSWRQKTVLRQLDPIYDRSTVDPSRDSTVVVGRDGYVVAGLVVEIEQASVSAVQVIFARFQSGRLQMSDNYKSEWMGVSTGQGDRQLAGDGRLVIGTYGRKGLNVDALGLVLAASN